MKALGNAKLNISIEEYKGYGSRRLNYDSRKSSFDSFIHDINGQVLFGLKPCKHNVVTKENVLKAIDHEKFVFYVFTKILGKRRLSIKSNDGIFKILKNSFDPNYYSVGSGPDLKIYKNNKLIVAIECKNWNTEQDRSFDGEHIFSRFVGIPQDVTKILIISSKKLLTLDTLNQLEEENIIILETGFITQDNFGDRLKQFITNYYHKIQNLLTMHVNKQHNQPTDKIHVHKAYIHNHKNYTSPIYSEKPLKKSAKNQYVSFPNWLICKLETVKFNG